MYLVGISRGSFEEYSTTEKALAAIEELIHEGFIEDEIVVYTASELSYNVNKTVEVTFGEE
jgi:hypothetical protein